MIVKKYIFLVVLVQYLVPVFGQIVTLSPSNAGAGDMVTLTFDAKQGNAELVGQSKVYVHHGVVLSSPTGTDWNYVIGNWGSDDGVGEMSPVPGQEDKWQIQFSPTIRSYFGVPAAQEIYRISCVFRSAGGGIKGTIDPGEYGWGTVASNLDYFINLNAGNYISFTGTSSSYNFIRPGQSVEISAAASAEVTTMSIWINEGQGYVEKAVVNSGTEISANFAPTETGAITVKVTAVINGESLEIERSQVIAVIQDQEPLPIPAGIRKGINYHTDETRATLAIEAPGKEYAYVIGDFTNWELQDAYRMTATPDGELFWLEIEGLVPTQEYVFQYWMNDNVKVGDPYADKVADPKEDKYISESTYPGLPSYDRTEFGVAAVLQTGQSPFEWSSSEDQWQRPDPDHLVIYELLVRDFLSSHNYRDLADTLPYLKNLGINAIELMPVSEFEGNLSWGYNPTYYFAPDKYYGTKNDLKEFIQAAHREGMAVILDMVLNHAEKPNPMVQMYFNPTTGKPAPNNPWFNENYVGPYTWGYDFNHESAYTQSFVDSVNAYWLEEFHFDGFRFDFTKGFTNYAPGGSLDGFDQSRINILSRMADKIWERDPGAYVILEHWGTSTEENQLASQGMKMWRNRSYDYVPASKGEGTGSFSGMNVQTHVSYFDSHDEQRITNHLINEGLAGEGYYVRDPLVALERAKMAAAFTFLFPGPKMIWQFDELGYDIDIDFNGRTGQKPLAWGPGSLGYYENTLRQYIYMAYKGILSLRKEIGPEKLASASVNHSLSGKARRLSYDTDGVDLVVIGNFGLSSATIDPAFSETGDWFDYFSGEEYTINNVSQGISLQPGQWQVFTSEKLSDGMPGVIERWDTPVTVSPYPFTKNDEVTITFDPEKAWPGNTAGLIDAEKVYFHSGVVDDDPYGTSLKKVVGTFNDDGLGEMTSNGDGTWEINLIPSEYYNIDQNLDIFRIGMWFRDATNENVGKGYRNSVIYMNVESSIPFVQIDPPGFDIDTEITLTFNARKGNQELVNANKVYIHTGVGLGDTNDPWNNAWTHVVGNWGNDDGTGEMTHVSGANDLWEITMTPRIFYNLQDGDVPYWIAAVFRNADGSVKGTGTPGEIENGIIHTNLDFFIRNQGIGSTGNVFNDRVLVYPNPSGGKIRINGFTGSLHLRVFDVSGKIVFDQDMTGTGEADLSELKKGMYLYRLREGNTLHSGKIILF